MTSSAFFKGQTSMEAESFASVLSLPWLSPTELYTGYLPVVEVEKKMEDGS